MISRREQVKQDTTDEILLIARDEMQRDGVAALSLGAIARRLGMRTPSLYTYFDSKNAIYDTLFRQGYEAFEQWMFEAIDFNGSARQQLEDAIVGYMSFAFANPDLYQLMFQRPVPGFVPSAESMAVSLDGLAKLSAQMGRILASEELAIDITLEEARDLYIALMHGLTSLHLANNPELPLGEGRFGKLVPQAVAMLLAAWQQPSQTADNFDRGTHGPE